MTDLPQPWSADRIAEHVQFLAGYMDAVGRSLTTDLELWVIDARVDKVLAATAARSPVDHWSREFDSLVRDYLHLDPCHRLGLYLVEYICWFREFTHQAMCFKLTCEPLQPGTLGQAVYLLQLEHGYHVVLSAARIDKTDAERVAQSEHALSKVSVDAS